VLRNALSRLGDIRAGNLSENDYETFCDLLAQGQSLEETLENLNLGGAMARRASRRRIVQEVRAYLAEVVEFLDQHEDSPEGFGEFLLSESQRSRLSI